VNDAIGPRQRANAPWTTKLAARIFVRAFGINEEDVMRFSNVFLGLAGVGAAAMLTLAGCGSSNGNSGGSGGTSSSTGTKSTSTTSTGTSSGDMCTSAPCAPTAACTAADKCCIGLVDNSKKNPFGLRMSSLDVAKPKALTGIAIASVISGAVEPDNTNCNLGGTATFNWLMEFDTTAKTLKTGGALPVMDPTKGYSFVNTMIGTNQVGPVTYSGLTIGADGSFSTMPLMQKLYVPIYLDPMGMSVVVLPLLNPAITMAKLSSNHDCIGDYNAAGLDPSASCAPDSSHPLFNDGGSLGGLITIADAETVDVAVLHETLCVLLTGMSDNAMPTAHCPMPLPTNGDSCSMAGQNCTDSFALTATFSASSVLINN
jgi:hypothetical protein